CATPEFGYAYVGRGTAWLGMEDYNKALKDFDEAIGLAPHNADAYSWLAWVLGTPRLEIVRDSKRAIRMATRACELTGWETGWQLNLLAAAYAQVGQFDEAERYQTKAL